VRLVFHGTPEKNIDAIAREGLDPTKRHAQRFGRGEYFTDDLATALPYMQGASRVLVFAVLMHKVVHHAFGTVVVDKPAQQVPLFILGVKHAGTC
jgi:hypothetical protein